MRTVVMVLVVVLVVLAAVAFGYRRQLGRRLTRRRGAPPARALAPWAPLPADGLALHLVVAGDVGRRGRRLDATARAVATLDARQALDGLVLLGDNVYPSGDPAALPDIVFRPFAPVLAHAPLYAVLGNHDVRHGRGDAQAAALGMPGRRWAEHLGPVLLVGLDSTRRDDPDQLHWLDRTLGGATEPWRVVVLHHPPYSAGYQGSSRSARRAFVPLFERHGVHLVLSGHDHDYQRSVPRHGVTYVVAGGASAPRRTGAEAFTAVSFGWHSVVEVGAYADRLVVRAVGADLTVADDAAIVGTDGGWPGS